MVNIETVHGYRNKHDCLLIETFIIETHSRLNFIPMENGKMFDLEFLYADFKFKDDILLRMVYND